MSFWNLNDSTEQLNTSGSFETGGGDIAPIPAKTQVKAAIDEVKWDMTNDGDEYISIRHTVLAPAEYNNRKVFQKLWVLGNNPNNKNPAAQGDKAKRMLAAISANCGGGLLKVEGKPSNQDLQNNLTGKPMALLLQVWKLEKDDGTTATGNWVSSVSPLNNSQPQQQAPVQQQQQAQSPNFDSSIGF